MRFKTTNRLHEFREPSGDLRRVYLQTSRYPDGEHTDIDCCNKGSCRNHDPFSTLSIGYDDTNTVNDNLQ
jgi:hypothetical protein